jgi:hypothetical protein
MKILLLCASMTNIGIAMAPGTLYMLAPPLIALQFAAFGWRVNREINLATAGGRPGYRYRTRFRRAIRLKGIRTSASRSRRLQTASGSK